MKTGRFMGMFAAALYTFMMNPAANIGPVPHFRGYALHGYNPEYHPRRGKHKGYMRENKRCSFNKNR